MKSFMIKYLYSVLQDLPEHLGTTTATPRADHLINVCDEGETQYLIEDQAKSFQQTVAQLLFMSATERQYIQMKVICLTTKMKNQTRMTGENEMEC